MIIETLDDALLQEVLFDSLNIGFPLQGRKWLSLLETDDDVGFLIRKDLKLPPEVLGFGFSSNRFGLRGPCDPTSGTAIFGTSYAMGFSVDDGDNWYDGLFSRGAMNYGLPVGLREFEVLFDRHHTGPCETAIFLYHPNIWAHVTYYVGWRQSGKTVFEHLRWDTSLTGALDRSRQVVTMLRGTAAGRPVVAEISGEHWLLNPTYGKFDLEGGRADYEAGIASLLGILTRFERVLVFRVPTKEELAASLLDHAPLTALKANHLAGWDYFKSAVVSRLDHCTVDEGEEFTLGDHHRCDTHWNRAGNAKMRDLLIEQGF